VRRPLRLTDRRKTRLPRAGRRARRSVRSAVALRQVGLEQLAEHDLRGELEQSTGRDEPTAVVGLARERQCDALREHASQNASLPRGITCSRIKSIGHGTMVVGSASLGVVKQSRSSRARRSSPARSIRRPACVGPVEQRGDGGRSESSVRLGDAADRPARRNHDELAEHAGLLRGEDVIDVRGSVRLCAARCRSGGRA